MHVTVMSAPEPIPAIVVRKLPTLSPSLAEALRMCPLRGLLYQSSGADNYVLGNPKAWLGTAYHKVLEQAACMPAEVGSGDQVGRLWADAIEALRSRGQAHPLNKRFGPPERWPGYHLALAGVRFRFSELQRKAPPREAAFSHDQAPAAAMREKRFAAYGGRLVGRPDLVERDSIIDYKSGAIFDDTQGTPTVKAGYARQLRIYGFLVHASLGWWPAKGALLPMLGENVEIELTPEACRREAEAAVALLDGVNARVASALSPSELASPSTASCSSCSYRMICPAYWGAATPSWSADRRYGDAEGVILSRAEQVHCGTAAALHVEIERGTVPAGRNVISPLALSVHDGVGLYAAAERIRLVGLSIRQNGQLAPTLYTVVMRTAALPAIETART